MGVMKADQFDWSPVRIEYLRTWWGKASATQISNKLGCSRSAAIGKAHRLGLPNLGNPVGRSRFDPKPEPRDPYQRRDETGARKVTGVPRGGIHPKRMALSTKHEPDLFDGPKPRPSGAKHSIAIRNGLAAKAKFLFGAKASAQVPVQLKAQLVSRVPNSDCDLELARVSPSVPAATAPRTLGIPFADLRADGCKWAVTPHDATVRDLRFCNAERPSHKPYCEAHQERARDKRTAPVAAGVDLSAPRARGG